MWGKNKHTQETARSNLRWRKWTHGFAGDGLSAGSHPAAANDAASVQRKWAPHCTCLQRGTQFSECPCPWIRQSATCLGFLIHERPLIHLSLLPVGCGQPWSKDMTWSISEKQLISFKCHHAVSFVWNLKLLESWASPLPTSFTQDVNPPCVQGPRAADAPRSGVT